MDNLYVSEYEDLKSQVFRVKKSRDSKGKVCFTNSGKVIIIQNSDKVKFGFCKIKSFVEKDRYILAKVENVVYDFWSEVDEEIPYEEFAQVLVNRGFTKELRVNISEEYLRNNPEMTPDNFIEFWANLSTGCLVSIETYNTTDRKWYNSVDVNIPVHSHGGATRVYFGSEKLGASSCFSPIIDYCITFSEVDFPLERVLRLSDNIPNWEGRTPKLWSYFDELSKNNFSRKIYADCARRIYKFKDDLETLFNLGSSEEIARHEKSIRERKDFG